MFNKIKLITLALILASMTFSNLSAKEMKIAIVDIQAVASQMPEMALIQQKVQDEFKEQLEDMKKLQADAKYNYDKLQREGLTLSTAQQDELKKTIIQQQQTLEEKGKPLQQQMQRRGSEMQNKVLVKIEGAIESVSKKEGYDFVFRKETLAYTPHSHVDISQKVLDNAKKL